MHTHKSYLYEYFRGLDQQILKIDKITNTSLSMETSHATKITSTTTESTIPLNIRIISDFQFYH